MRYELALFAGAGGGLLATQHLLGWQTVCYVEREAYPVTVLKARIKDGFLDDAPIWSNVRTFRHDNPECGRFVDHLAKLDNLVITAGFPCQPFAAGGKQRGAGDPRNCWPDTIRIIGEVKPAWVFLENSPNLLYARKDGAPPYIQQIAGELATLGYVGRWGCISAYNSGADHKRQRLWIVAHASQERRAELLRRDAQDSISNLRKETAETTALGSVWDRLARLEKSLGEPSVFRTSDGLAHQVDRLGAIGEGQVPVVVEKAWKILSR